jgi:hypothetical protein
MKVSWGGRWFSQAEVSDGKNINGNELFGFCFTACDNVFLPAMLPSTVVTALLAMYSSSGMVRASVTYHA